MFKETPLKIEKALPRNKGQEEEDQAPVASSANTGDAPVSSNAEKSGGNKRSGKKPRRGGSAGTSTGSSDAEGIRPDPRWASELEKLKQMLAAQTTNG
jgi:type IV secretory pathway TrbL component